MPKKIVGLFESSGLVDGFVRHIEAFGFPWKKICPPSAARGSSGVTRTAMLHTGVIGALLLVGTLLLSTPSFEQVRALITIAPPGVAGLRAAPLPGRRLSLDAWLLGLGGRRLLLGPGRMGAAARSRLPLDSGLLGLGRRRISVQ